VAVSGNVSAVVSAATAVGQTGALNHNTEGALFVLALAVLLAWLPRSRRGAGRLVVMIAIAVLAAGVAFSFSRSAYFGAAAVLALFAIRRSVRGLVSAAVVVAAVVPLMPAAVVARLGTLWNTSQDTSSSVRLDLWTSALRMFQHNPVFGVGYLNFSAQLPAYYQDSGNYSASILNFPQLEFAHNTYLTILSQTGLVGVLLVGIVVTGGWRRAWHASRAGDWAGEGAVLAFAGAGVCSLFGEPLFDTAFLAAFLLVVAAARPGPALMPSRSRRPSALGSLGHV
jgi:O-antigen ligase